MTFATTDDVAEIVARTAFVPSAELPDWNRLSRRARRRQRDRAKVWLNTDAVERMTAERLAESDPAGEVVGWIVAIRVLLHS